jgi:hypothetical protein
MAFHFPPAGNMFGSSQLPRHRVFNDDLLTNPGDLQYVHNQFPHLVVVLDHPELRQKFIDYDEVANKAHGWVHRLGFVAVSLITCALLSAATEPFWHDLAMGKVLAIALELFGLFAALIAGGSLWLGPWRKRWLESRFMTERLRQWHFQLLVRKGSEIERAVGQSTPKAWQDFTNQRKTWFEAFLREYEGKLDSRMDSLANDPQFSCDWLHRSSAKSVAHSPAFEDLTEAYRRLRLDHQYDYVAYKLSASTDRPFWLFLKHPLLRQQSAIRDVVSFCFGTALLCSIGIIVNRYFSIKPSANAYLASATVVMTIIGVAVRTIQEGLGIDRDIERYRDYRSKVGRILLRYEEGNQATKRQLMEEMELAVVDELRGFLRAHKDNAFAL